MRVLVIADDLTGALDTTCKFGKNSFVLLSGDMDADFIGVTTDSRLLRPEEARIRVKGVLKRFGSWQYLYKKVDSTMRGNVGAELSEVCEFLDSKMPFTPAYPEQGRIVVDGMLYVGGRPLEETSYARELPLRSSNILEILRATTDTSVGYWGDDQDILTFKDIVSRSDLSEAARCILESGFRVMGGSAGLAMELSRSLGCEEGEEVCVEGPMLFLSGSENEVTKEQFSVLSTQISIAPFGEEGVSFTERRLKLGEDAAMMFKLGEVLNNSDSLDRIVEIILDSKPSALVVVGGETLRVLLNRLSVSAIRIGSYPEDGISAGWILGGPLDGTPLISKAGGFGDPETLLRVLKNVKRTSRGVSSHR